MSTITGTLTRHRLLAIALLLLVAPLPFAGSFYLSRLLVLFVLFALLTVAVNVVFGHADQLYLFSGGLAAIGAYVTALLSMAMGVSPWLTVLVGGMVAGLAGLVVSYVATRLRMTVAAMAILTLGLQLGIVEFLSGAREITGGDSGFAWSGFELDLLHRLLPFGTRIDFYYLLVGLLIVVLLVYDRLVRSRFGLAVESIRQDRTASSATGIDVLRYQSMAGFIGAGIIGVTGSFYASFTGFVQPSMYTFLAIDAQILIMLILGGRRTMFGPILGAAVVLAISESLQGVNEFRAPVFGLLLIVLFIYFPDGAIPRLADLDRSAIRATLSDALKR